MLYTLHFSALNDATQWYKENKVLKRRTLLLDNDTVDEGVDTDESNSDSTDLENLKDSVKQLSQEVAQLQAELNSVKLLEFEATEANANLTQVNYFLTNQLTDIYIFKNV